jgi:hypothetical protein
MDLIDPNNAQEIFFDGINDVKIIKGVVRAVLFARQNGVGIVAARLRLPAVGLPDVIQALVIALAEAAKTNIKPKR